MPSRHSPLRVHEHRFPDSTALAHALSGEIRVDLEEAIGARKSASLVVSGGRTPLKLFRQLCAETADWKNIWVTLADERNLVETWVAGRCRFGAHAPIPTEKTNMP